MSIPLSAVPGGLLTRIGHLKSIADAINTTRGTTVPTKTEALVVDLATGDARDAASLETALASYQSSASGFLSTLKTLASRIVIDMAADDGPQPDGTFATAMRYVLAQMKATSQTVQRSTVGLSVAATSGNTGDAVIVGSVLGSFGVPMENLFAEAITATCTADSQSGGATALREPIRFVGKQAVSDTLNYAYPAGSGATLTLSCVDASQNEQGGSLNFLNNGSFETFTVTNVPDGWHVVTGTAGTQVVQSTAQHLDGASSLALVGDGSTLTALYQAFGSDTIPTLRPNRQYGFCLWAKVNTAPAAGALAIVLTDASNAVTSDGASTANTVTADLTTLTTTFAPITGVFRTGPIVPAGGFRLGLKLTTALSSGSTLFLDRMAFAPLIQFYAGGPSLAVFSGQTPMIAGDSFTVTTSNNRAGLLQAAADALLPMRSNGFLLPSVASSPTIPDSLVA